MEPRKLKDALVRDWIEGEAKIGVRQDPAKIERTVLRDLERWDRQKADAKTVKRSKQLAKKQTELRKRINDDTSVFQREVPKQPDHVPFSKMPCGGCGTCKMCKMLFRMAMVTQRDAQGRPLYPGLHKQYHYEALLHAAGAGPYFKLSRVDKARRLLRRFEDICDQSNGIPGLGNWWVK